MGIKVYRQLSALQRHDIATRVAEHTIPLRDCPHEVEVKENKAINEGPNLRAEADGAMKGPWYCSMPPGSIVLTIIAKRAAQKVGRPRAERRV